MFKRVLYCFTNDLRVHDNLALNAASDGADELCCVYVFDQSLHKSGQFGTRPLGPKRRQCLQQSLANLGNSLARFGLYERRRWQRLRANFAAVHFEALSTYTLFPEAGDGRTMAPFATFLEFRRNIGMLPLPCPQAALPVLAPNLKHHWQAFYAADKLCG
jgi:hypothetical protein